MEALTTTLFTNRGMVLMYPHLFAAIVRIKGAPVMCNKY